VQRTPKIVWDGPAQKGKSWSNYEDLELGGESPDWRRAVAEKDGVSGWR